MLNKLKNPRILFPFFMALAMALVMSGFMSFLHLGFVDNFFAIWMHAFSRAFLVAFTTAYFVAPQVQKLVQYICSHKK